MSFVVFVLYLGISYLFPGEIFPELQAYHITLWAGVGSLVISVITLVIRPRPLNTITPIGLVAGLVLSMMVSTTWANRWLGAPLYVLQSFGPTLTIFLLVLWNVRSSRQLRLSMTVMVILSVILVTQGVAAYHFGYMQDKLLLREDSDDVGPEPEVSQIIRVRSLGQLNDPNDLALALIATLPMLSIGWKRRRPLRNTLLVLAPALFLIYGIYLTRSRGGLLGVIAVMFTFLVNRLGRSRGIVATAVLGAVLVASNFTGGRKIGADESAEGRVDAWSEGLDMFRASPVLGVGLHNFEDHHTRTAHNSFVLCFAELGLLGYLFWTGLLFWAAIQIKQVLRCKDTSGACAAVQRYALALTASLTGVMTAAFFLSRSYNSTVFILFALACALYGIAQDSGCALLMPKVGWMSVRVAGLELISIAAMYLIVRVNRFLL